MQKIILASTSPRRKKLLETIGLPFSIEKSNYPEVLDQKITAEKLAEQLAFKKADTVAKKHQNALVIGADTFIVFRGKYLGKPANDKDAKAMLQMLSGKKHQVVSAFCLIDTSSKKVIIKSITSNVWLRKIAEKEIDLYLKTKEPQGKAGAYAVQELGMIFVKKIEGDYQAIVGLSIHELSNALTEFGVSILKYNLTSK